MARDGNGLRFVFGGGERACAQEEFEGFAAKNWRLEAGTPTQFLAKGAGVEELHAEEAESTPEQAPLDPIRVPFTKGDHPRAPAAAEDMGRGGTAPIFDAVLPGIFEEVVAAQ